jgi:hypothetical protein
LLRVPAKGPFSIRFADLRHSEADTIRKEYGYLDPRSRPRTRSSSSTWWSCAIPGVPLETSGALARYNPSADVIELHGAAKVAHATRDVLSRVLGRSPV